MSPLRRGYIDSGYEPSKDDIQDYQRLWKKWNEANIYVQQAQRDEKWNDFNREIEYRMKIADQITAMEKQNPQIAKYK